MLRGPPRAGAPSDTAPPRGRPEPASGRLIRTYVRVSWRDGARRPPPRHPRPATGRRVAPPAGRPLRRGQPADQHDAVGHDAHLHVRHGRLHAARAGRRRADDGLRSRRVAAGVPAGGLTARGARPTRLLRLSDRVVMTAEAQAALQAELERLETDARQEIAARIKTAREWGDLKENAEYHDAKNDQAHLETKILRIREQLLAADVREVETQTDVVGFGSTVEVEDAGGRRTIYTLVSAPEAAPSEGRVSMDSPVGRALAGARGGDERSLETPRGERRLTVLTIG